MWTIAATLLTTALLAQQPAAASEDTVTLQIRNLAASEILEVLAEHVDRELVLEGDWSDPISVEYVAVPWKMAFEQIAKMQGGEAVFGEDTVTLRRSASDCDCEEADGDA